MGALRHGVRLTLGVVAEVAAGHHAGVFEPVPGGADLAAVASHAEAREESTAASGVCGRQEGCEPVLDAESVVERLGGAVSPARAAVALVAGVVNDVFACRPLHTGVEGVGDAFG